MIILNTAFALSVFVGLCVLVLSACHENHPGMKAAGTVGRPSASGRTEKATFAAGCFWGVEEAFRQVEGVTATRVGYTGGHVANPTYEQVCTGQTGHAEAVEVTYDPEAVSYDHLLDVFWANHDPTTPNRQGPDIGSQYRSAVFHHNAGQREAAEASLRRQQEKSRRRIVTEITPVAEFYEAEAYHQQYLARRGLGACRTK